MQMLLIRGKLERVLIEKKLAGTAVNVAVSAPVVAGNSD
jgi:hypothetical protein